MKDKKFQIMFIVCAGLQILWFILYLIAYYPGMMTVDSIDQWAQIVTLKFDDWHPVGHTLFNYLCTRIWYSPASIAIAQILILTAVFFYGIYVLYKRGVSKVVLSIVIVLFTLYPTNGFMSVILWKDVLFSIMLMWMTVQLINIVFTKGQWISSRKNQIGFILNSFGVLFFRHNGILTFMFVVLLLMLLFRKYFKQWAVLGICILAVYFIVTGPVYKMMQVRVASSTEAMGIPMQQIAAVVKFNGILTAEQKDFISKILPLEVWREKYHPYITNPLKFDEAFNPNFLTENKVEFIKCWLAIIKQNPKITTEAYLKQTSMIWKIRPYSDSFTYTITPKIIKNDYGLESTVISGKISNYAEKVFHFTEKESPMLFFWRPALWLYLALLSGMIIVIRINWKALIIVSPLVSNTLAFFIAIPSQDYRYQYSNVLIAAILLPLAIQLLVKREAAKVS